MDRYTVLGKPIVDVTIERHLDYITQKIVDRIHPESIILTGSFGRGEGSVILEDSKVKILSDYEIGIVTRKFWKRQVIDELIRELSSQLRVEVSLFWIRPSSLKRNKSRNLSFGSSLPSIFMYELKAGSKVLYGENCLGKNLIDPSTIPLWEGIRLIYNRMAEALKYPPIYSTKESNSRNDDFGQLRTAFGINKLVLAILDALLLSIGKYHYSYRVKEKIFCNQYKLHFEHLLHQSLYFSLIVEEAVKFKLTLEQNARCKNITNLWFEVVRLCDPVFRYLIKKELNITFHSYGEFQEKYLKHPNIKHAYAYYYIPPLPSYLSQNVANLLKMRKSYQIHRIRALNRVTTPWDQIVYSTIPLVFFGLKGKNTIDRYLLEKSRKTVEQFIKLRGVSRDPWQEWCYLKEETLKIWKVIC